MIDGLIAGWLAEHPRDGYERVVAHIHGHRRGTPVGLTDEEYHQQPALAS